ncbi:MAG: T9SS type A sorting domain-containing protein [Gemmatimonadota bacterium]
MHSLRGKQGRIATLLFALAAATTLPSPAAAGPEPGAKPSASRFRLFAGSLGAMTINRVAYGLSTGGLVGVDSTNSSTIGGGFWPRGTGDQYMFNSGLQVSGIIAGAKSASNPWGGDTTGGFFFDPRGTNEHGIGITDLYNSTNPTDVANWPTYGFVPQGDSSEVLFDPLLRGRLSASQGDVWFMSWEGDPGVNSGRPHPLGIVAEYRGLGWNYPAGNEDIIYFIVTFYNITSVNPAAYANARPGLREKLISTAQDFQRLNNAKFGVTLPTEGYTINPFYAAFSADEDVASAGTNYATVNLPFAMAFAYDASFSKPAGWKFDPAIFGKPFFAGAGFVGIKYLKSPSGPGEIALFSLTTNGGAFPDASNTTRLFRYMSGDVGPDLGVQCNNGIVQISHICYVLQGSPIDVRTIQSAKRDSLKPGEAKSIVVAYVHAAPVALTGYTTGGVQVAPGDPTRLSNATLLAQGANRIDSMMGFAGYTDGNSDGIVQQDEFTVIKGSVLGKGLVAQAVFDGKFLLPFAPEAPDFFLIPGNEQVTVLWKPSASEVTGDAFFQIANQPKVTPPGGGALVDNALYDPNYRKFDVEGYRIYRGRIDSPGSLRLIAQYDYAGTSFVDFGGQVPLGSACAPEINVTTSCAGVFDPIAPGVARTKSRSYDISGQLVQVKFGDRVQLASGDILPLTADTAVTGGNSGYPALSNTGVPFAYTDRDVKNGLTYYYAVTAFDYNSIQSGPTSLESARITKRVVPNTQASNYVNTAVTESGVFGRKGLVSDPVAPAIDPATGKFSKKFQPANGLSVSLAAFVKELIKAPGEVGVKLDSITIGSQADGGNQNATQYFTITTPNGSSKIAVPLPSDLTTAIHSATGSFPAITADADLAAKYGGGAGYGLAGAYSISIPSGYYVGVTSRGCVNGAGGYSGTSCFYNGPRWFVGDNETKSNPNSANAGTFNSGVATTDYNNVGATPTGVTTIHMPKSYSDRPGGGWRFVEGAMTPFVSAADYRLYWGAGGKVDSVIDLTHDVAVPNNGTGRATWGILNASAVSAAQSYDQRAELTASDISCVEPYKSHNLFISNIPCSGTAVALSNTVVPGPIVFDDAYNGGNVADRTAPAAPGAGFILYLKGRYFLVELTGGAVPAAGAQWTMRDYVGAVNGGNGAAGNGGNYSFSTQGMPRPMTAVGAAVKFKFDVTNEVQPSTAATVATVHTVPDPYYVTSAFEATTTSKIIRFVNLPEQATVRIYTSSGILVRVLKQSSGIFGGELTWDVRNRNNQFVASGVYFYHVTAENGETTVGRMTIVNYAQ